MSGILCCWANLPEESAEWYENEYIPSMRNPNAAHSIHCEVTASGMENEPVGKLDSPWPWMTVYEIRDIAQSNKATEQAAKNPGEEVKKGLLKGARFDVRTYRELKRWQEEDWEGEGGGGKIASSDEALAGLMPLDIEHVASIAAMEWKVAADKEEEVLKFYEEVVGPTIASSPDVLRFRLFKIDYATTMDNGSYTINNKDELHKYFTLVELETEEWPWDVVVDLADDKCWKDYFETQDVVVSHAIPKSMQHG